MAPAGLEHAAISDIPSSPATTHAPWAVARQERADTEPLEAPGPRRLRTVLAAATGKVAARLAEWVAAACGKLGLVGLPGGAALLQCQWAC